MGSSIKLSLIIFFACSLQGTLADVVCESLPTNLCSFAIASSGKRCFLENYMNAPGNIGYMCRTSEVVAERLSGSYIESDECVSACGVDRGFLGISSNSFLEPEFAKRLCLPACYRNCPNIVDLYDNVLASAEGILYLQALCEKMHMSNPHRTLLDESDHEERHGPVSSYRGPSSRTPPGFG